MNAVTTNLASPIPTKGVHMTIQRPMRMLLGCGAAVALAFAVMVETLPAQWGYYGGYSRPGLSVQWPGGGLSISGSYRPHGYYYGGYAPYSTYYPSYSYPSYPAYGYGYRAYYPSYGYGYYVRPRYYRRGFDYDNDFDFDFDD